MLAVREGLCWQGASTQRAPVRTRHAPGSSSKALAVRILFSFFFPPRVGPASSSSSWQWFQHQGGQEMQV